MDMMIFVPIFIKLLLITSSFGDAYVNYKTCLNEDAEYSEWQRIKERYPAYDNIDAPNNTYMINVVCMIDAKAIELLQSKFEMRSNLLDWTRKVFMDASNLFEQLGITIGYRKIRIPILPMDASEVEYYPPHVNDFRDFATNFITTKYYNLISNITFHKPHVIVWITGHDFKNQSLGRGTQGNICSEDAPYFSLVEVYLLAHILNAKLIAGDERENIREEMVRTLSHEIGHNLGLNHDFFHYPNKTREECSCPMTVQQMKQCRYYGRKGATGNHTACLMNYSEMSGSHNCPFWSPCSHHWSTEKKLQGSFDCLLRSNHVLWPDSIKQANVDGKGTLIAVIIVPIIVIIVVVIVCVIFFPFWKRRTRSSRTTNSETPTRETVEMVPTRSAASGQSVLPRRTPSTGRKTSSTESLPSASIVTSPPRHVASSTKTPPPPRTRSPVDIPSDSSPTASVTQSESLNGPTASSPDKPARNTKSN